MAGSKTIAAPTIRLTPNRGEPPQHLPQPRIQRHRTALSRTALSRPIRCALEDGVINTTTTVLDYGCGRGSDVSRLKELGISCLGWDPEHAADVALTPADVVNLGYVANVIESQSERREALVRAWSFAQR